MASWWLQLCGAHTVIVLAAVLMAMEPMLHRVWRVPQTSVSAGDKDPEALRVGLLGASFISRVAVVFAAGKSKDVEIVAVASRDSKRAQDFATRNGILLALGGPTAYNELLLRDDIDAVYISVPTSLHYKWAMAALEHGKHVLLEKPMTLNSQEATRLQSKAADVGLVLMEAAHYRHHPAAQRFRDMLAGVGDLAKIEADFHMLDPKAWLSSLSGSRRERSEHERMKNLDRWWYCVDELLWFTNATSAEVLLAEEGRFSLTAELRLHRAAGISSGNSTILATARMSRDRFWPPFVWSVQALPSSGGGFKFMNVGFPFLWHRIHSWAAEPGGELSDALYGEGETTFEHQLKVFVAAVRRSASADLQTSVSTMSMVDSLLASAGSGPLSGTE